PQRGDHLGHHVHDPRVTGLVVRDDLREVRVEEEIRLVGCYPVILVDPELHLRHVVGQDEQLGSGFSIRKPAESTRTAIAFGIDGMSRKVFANWYRSWVMPSPAVM